MKTRAYFIGGVADGQVREFDARPPDRMQACTDQMPLNLDGPPKPIERTMYNRSDLTGGTVVYVPAGTLLHDAFIRVLDTYAESKKES
jgi:hypothetical protein